MKKFETYKESKDIRKITPNPNEIKAIIEDSIKRFNTFYEQRNNKEMTKYESIRELSECITLKNGLKIYSHEITISYLLHKQILNEGLASTFDNFRKLRNQSKYYGQRISEEKLQESLDDLIKIKNILLKQLRKE